MHVYTWRRGWQQRNGGCSQGCRKAFLIASCEPWLTGRRPAGVFQTLCARSFYLLLGFVSSRARIFVRRRIAVLLPLSRGRSRDCVCACVCEMNAFGRIGNFCNRDCSTIGQRMRLRLQSGYIILLFRVVIFVFVFFFVVLSFRWFCCLMGGRGREYICCDERAIIYIHILYILYFMYCIYYVLINN